jgi:hypothetical protein
MFNIMLCYKLFQIISNANKWLIAVIAQLENLPDNWSTNSCYTLQAYLGCVNGSPQNFFTIAYFCCMLLGSMINNQNTVILTISQTWT